MWFWNKLENHNIGIFFMCKMFNLGAKLYKTEILQSTFWKGCIELERARNPLLWPNKHIQIDSLSPKFSQWGGLNLIHSKADGFH